MPDVYVPQTRIEPQDGFQKAFLASPADITIGGGGAGLGKSWCLQVAPLRHKDIKGFNCITFRLTKEQIRNPGGLWDKAQELYPVFGMRGYEQPLEWINKANNVTFKYSHLQHEKNIYDHDGAEYCLECWDELQHFSKKKFFYLLSRNRSTCGVTPYVLATCNPEPDSFLADFLSWWIDQEEKMWDGSDNPNWGFPIKERLGVLRYMFINDDVVVWGNSKQEVYENNLDFFSEMDIRTKPFDLIKSVTFISGSIYDNQKLLETNPGYLANLMALDEIEKMRLLNGNWKVRTQELGLFNSSAIDNAFNNPLPDLSSYNYITCDAARFGDDLCTIFTWQGWHCIRLDVMTKSSQDEIVAKIEMLRRIYNVIKTRVCVDQDGVGGSVVKKGRYIGFSGADKPILVAEVRNMDGQKIRENYYNLKTQLSYRYAERLNNNGVALDLSAEDSIYVDGYHGSKIKINGTTHDVRDLIKLHYKSIRKKDVDIEGKKRINEKMDQKRILKGWSPDFYDGSFIRELFAIKDHEIKVGNVNSVKGFVGSILDRI